MSYHVTYKIEPHPEGIERSQVPEGHGAASAVVICSIIYPPDGGLGLELLSHDGRTAKPLEDLEFFKLWAMMAYDLAHSETLSAAKRELCGVVHDCITAALRASRAGDSDDEGCLYADPQDADPQAKSDEPS